MNNYELVLILHPDLGEKEIEKLTQELKAILTNLGATQFTGEHTERRALAYPIKKQREATYLFLDCTGPGTLPEKIRYELRHNEQILRMAVVRKPVVSVPPAGETQPSAADEPAQPAGEV